MIRPVRGACEDAVVRRIWALRPLLAPETYSRGVYLLLGGVVGVPYVALAAVFVQAIRGNGGADIAMFVLLAGLTIVVGAGVAVLPASRALAITATRTLLGVELPEPEPDSATRWDVRRRVALWYVASVLTGGAMLMLVLFAVPTGLGLCAVPFTDSATAQELIRRTPASADGIGPSLATIAAGLAMVLGTVYSVAGAGAGLARLAPALLGPTEADEIAALRRRERAAAARNELARELHDSIGHALTAMTVQASAGARVLERDPAFATRAFHHIENTARAALEDLDHVLGILRANDSGGNGPGTALPAAAPAGRSLADLPALFTAYPADRVEVTLAGDPVRVPAAVSREAYRVAQEAVTNAVRHGADGPIMVSITVSDKHIRLEVDNPRGSASRPGTGRGLLGIRERIALHSGTVTAGPSGDRWVVVAEIPWEGQ